MTAVLHLSLVGVNWHFHPNILTVSAPSVTTLCHPVSPFKTLHSLCTSALCQRVTLFQNYTSMSPTLRSRGMMTWGENRIDHGDSQLSVMARDSKQSVYTYSSKRSRTRTSSAFATLCNHPTVMSLRPFIQLFTVCRVTPKRRPNSASLTFFSSSLCAGSAATHNCSFSS